MEKIIRYNKNKIQLVILFCIVVITLVGVLMPIQTGVIGLVQNLMKWGGIALVFAYLGIVAVVTMFSAKTIDVKSIVAVVLMATLSIIGAYFSLQTVKAFNASKEIVVSSEYKVKDNVVRRSFLDVRRLTVTKEDGSTVTIEITRDMYNELKQDKRTIKVTYYPYVNIVDTIEYVD